MLYTILVGVKRCERALLGAGGVAAKKRMLNRCMSEKRDVAGPVSSSLRRAIVLAAVLAASAIAQPCPDKPVPATSSPAMPSDVCIPASFTAVPIAYFDDYSWRQFIALVWPAKPGQRGAADAAKSVGDAGARVFETFKSLWEVFHEDGSSPEPGFSKYDGSNANACNVKPQFGDLVLASFSGDVELGQAGTGELTGPLAAQNGTYLRYLTLYNQVAFDYLIRNRFFLRSSLPEIPSPRPPAPVLHFPDGSIALKAAWIMMKGLPEELRQRYYTRMAFVRDPANGQCSRVEVGLAGLHVMQKTPTRPQWNWASWEQVDSVPSARPGSISKFALNDGSGAPMPAENPLALVPLAPEPVRPFNVARLAAAPIHPDTASTNQAYEAALKGTPWEHYELVVSQWPRLDGDQSIPVPVSQSGDAAKTFPGLGATSAIANLTMETFLQQTPQLGCMGCHNQARMSADFMWSVLDHAYPAKLAPAAGAVRDRGAVRPAGNGSGK